jgi:hypothetical protein
LKSGCCDFTESIAERYAIFTPCSVHLSRRHINQGIGRHALFDQFGYSCLDQTLFLRVLDQHSSSQCYCKDAPLNRVAVPNTLKAKAIETTQSDAPELIAKAFGYESWNILSAKIEEAEPSVGAQPPAGDKRSLSIAAFRAASPPKTLYCSFCGKSQHEIRKLIAGPTVFICDSVWPCAPTL